MKTRAALGLTLALAFVWGACDSEDNPPMNVDSNAPAGVIDLAVDSVTASTITLSWTAPGDDNTSGRASAYTLKQSSTTINSSNFDAATTVPGVPPPGNAGAAESFTVAGLDSNLAYYFALRTRDDAGNISPVSNNAMWAPRTDTFHVIKVIPAFMDNTIYAESDTLSNAKGQYSYAGTNNNNAMPRRALLAFAIADSLPAGAVIDSVTLRLVMTKKTPGAGDATVTLRRLTAPWGEGTSIANLGPGEGGGGSVTPGDATWSFQFYDTDLWSVPGGDFALGGVYPVVTTSTLGPYVWQSAQMTADVQQWLDTPTSNFGWILMGQEGGAATVRQFGSRENAIAADRPRLTVYITVGP